MRPQHKLYRLLTHLDLFKVLRRVYAVVLLCCCADMLADQPFYSVMGCRAMRQIIPNYRVRIND